MSRVFAQPGPENEALLKLHLDEINLLIAKRRASWVLTTEPWEDVSMRLLTHVWRRIHAYDPTRPFDRWCNTVLTNEVRNILRDKLYKNAKPCISAGPSGGRCVFNDGDNLCSLPGNTSGLQCSKCPIYAVWEKTRQSKHNINATLSLENHTDEVHNRINDSFDTAAAKVKVEARLMLILTKEEATVYRLLFIKHWSMKRVGTKMGYKVQDNNKVPGYQRLTKMQSKFKRMIRQIVIDEGIS